MRDGVKLKTFILVPKGANRAPMLLTRTPYNAAERVSRFESPRMAAVVPQMDDTAVAAGYIIVFQDVRGKYGSEGDYVMTRPLVGPLNPTEQRSRHRHLRHDRLAGEERARIQRPRRHDGRLVRGIHDGDVDRASAPCAESRGAFRADGGWLDRRRLVPQRRLSTGRHASNTSMTRKGRARTTRSGGPARATPMRTICGWDRPERWRHRGAWNRLGFWRDLVAHPAYDAFWQDQAVDRVLASEPLQVPMLIVSGLFDQEDIYGGPALYKALCGKRSARREGASRARVRGITGRVDAKVAASARFNSKATRRRGFAAT